MNPKPSHRPPRKARRLWAQIVARVPGLQRRTFHSYHPTAAYMRIMAIDSGTLVLQCPTSIFRSCVEVHHHTAIMAAAGAELGQPVTSIRYEIPERSPVVASPEFATGSLRKIRRQALAGAA